jgi:hypothetical protein
MLQRRFVTGQPYPNFAQRIHMRHLAKRHGQELLPAVESLVVTFGPRMLKCRRGESCGIGQRLSS